MERCKNCKHWNNSDYSSKNFGECNNDKFVYTGDDTEAPIDGLGYSDSEGYNAEFFTGAEFGCIHFLKKE